MALVFKGARGALIGVFKQLVMVLNTPTTKNIKTTKT
jgi:hypothetical protein